MDADFDLRSALPSLLPGAVAWAEARSAEAALAGDGLNESGIGIARSVGVQRPELVRVSIVDTLPMPEDTGLRTAALQTGLLGPRMVGLTLGYSILICRGHESIRLLSHELRHVHQYEANGSIAGFLPIYLQQIAIYGYQDAPFEVDARAHEQDEC
jgi:hypothetical protein